MAVVCGASMLAGVVRLSVSVPGTHLSPMP